LKKNNIKISILCNYRLLPERVGGMDRFFWALDQKAKVAGHLITWFFPNQAQHGYYPQMQIIAQEHQSVETTFLQYAQSFDVVVTHFLEICTPFFQTIKQRNLAQKTIVVDHNPRPIGGYTWKKQIKKRWKGWWYAKYIDRFVGVSAYTVQELQKDFGQSIKNKCQVIYNGIETEKYAIQNDRKTTHPRLMVVSHLRYSKGIQDLIQAVALLPHKILQEIKITVYGDGPEAKDLKKLAQTLQVSHCFGWMGSSSSLETVYAQYDYLLHPTHMECFSLTLLESLSSNVPVVTTPVGGNEEVVQHQINGWILPAQNPVKWADFLQQLWTGQEKITNPVEVPIREKFSLANMVQEHWELIINL